MTPSNSPIWARVLERIEAKLNRHTFLTWFAPTRLLRDQGDALTVEVPDTTVRDWLLRHYGTILAEALAEIGRPGASVAFVAAADAAAEGYSPQEEALLHQAADAPVAAEPGQAGTAGLNPRYSFDTFVVGPSNQFAHAAARAVAETPGRSYNPLFVYGGVGLGKTHLMHAIGQYIVRHDAPMAPTYT